MIGHEPVPRDADAARKLVGQLVPSWGFFAYGALYLYFVAAPAGLAACLGSMFLLAKENTAQNPMQTWKMALALAAGLGAFTLACWPFVRWIRRRRGEALLLLTEGLLFEATVTSAQLITVRGASITRAVLLVAQREWVASAPQSPVDLQPGQRVPILVHPACAYAAAWIGDRFIAAR